MGDEIERLVERAQQEIAKEATPNRFLDLLEAGAVPTERLTWLAGELHRLVSSDKRSFALLASRFPTAPAGDLFLTMAQGEAEALRLLTDFATAIGMDSTRLEAYEPRPLAQAYPAYLTQTALHGTQSDIALALLANVEESGTNYTRAANALRTHHNLTEAAVAHFRYFAETPQSILDLATATIETGLSKGDSPDDAIRTARMVNAYEAVFWETLTTGL